MPRNRKTIDREPTTVVGKEAVVVFRKDSIEQLQMAVDHVWDQIHKIQDEDRGDYETAQALGRICGAVDLVQKMVDRL